MFTFALGVSIAALGRLRPTSLGEVENPVSRQSSEQTSVDFSAWRVLLSYEGRDLRKLGRESGLRLEKAVEALLGRRGGGERALIVPRLVSKLSDADGQTRYALIEEKPLLSIPGQSRINAHVFDPEGDLLNSSEFNSGHRISITGMQVEHSPEIGRELLVVNSKASFNGADIARQFYALVGKQLLLIRLENSGCQPVRNTYIAPNHTIGVRLAGRSADEWVGVMKSSDTVESLAALMWVGGTHLNPRTGAPGHFLEDMSEARLVEEIRAREDTKATTNALIKSDNAWLRTASGLTRKFHYSFKAGPGTCRGCSISQRNTPYPRQEGSLKGEGFSLPEVFA